MVVPDVPPSKPGYVSGATLDGSQTKELVCIWALVIHTCLGFLRQPSLKRDYSEEINGADNPVNGTNLA